MCSLLVLPLGASSLLGQNHSRERVDLASERAVVAGAPDLEPHRVVPPAVAGDQLGAGVEVEAPRLSAVLGEVEAAAARVDVAAGGPAELLRHEVDLPDRPFGSEGAPRPGLAAVGGSVQPPLHRRGDAAAADPAVAVVEEEGGAVEDLV